MKKKYWWSKYCKFPADWVNKARFDTEEKYREWKEKDFQFKINQHKYQNILVDSIIKAAIEEET